MERIEKEEEEGISKRIEKEEEEGISKRIKGVYEKEGRGYKQDDRKVSVIQQESISKMTEGEASHAKSWYKNEEQACHRTLSYRSLT